MHIVTAGFDARNNRVKNNLPTYRDRYGHSRNHRWEALKRAHPVVLGIFCIILFCRVVLCNIFINGPTKKDPPLVDASRRDLSDDGLGSFVTILVCW